MKSKSTNCSELSAILTVTTVLLIQITSRLWLFQFESYNILQLKMQVIEGLVLL